MSDTENMKKVSISISDSLWRKINLGIETMDDVFKVFDVVRLHIRFVESIEDES